MSKVAAKVPGAVQAMASESMAAGSLAWTRRRLAPLGIRPDSLAVTVTLVPVNAASAEAWASMRVKVIGAVGRASRHSAVRKSAETSELMAIIARMMAVITPITRRARQGAIGAVPVVANVCVAWSSRCWASTGLQGIASAGGLASSRAVRSCCPSPG